MTSLLDIGPLTEEVSVGGKMVTVRGASPEGFFYLLEKFPILQKMFSGGVKSDLDMGTLRSAGPDCVAHALAVVTTDRSRYASFTDWSKDVEAAAKVALNLSAHHQMAIFQTGLRLTFPDGIGPFMSGVEALAESINRVSGQTARPTMSSRPSRTGFVTDSRGMRLGQGAPSVNSRH